jgi:AcrR family transcriptional regulator
MSAIALIDKDRRTQAERTALSDSRMLDAAVELICAKGTIKTTLKEVGVVAGYSRGLASHRFGTKDQLFTFIVRSVGELWLKELSLAVKEEVGVNAIGAAIDAHQAFITQGANNIRAFYILWFNSIGPDRGLREVVANIHLRRQKDVESWIQKGVANKELCATIDYQGAAQNFCAAIIGIVYQWLADPENVERIKELHTILKAQTTLALGKTH